MLSAIGLALDLVGATALVLGLFGHARPLVPGYVRSPLDVAHDVSFGITGAVLLSAGFVLQSLTYFDVSLDCSTRNTLIAAGLTLVSAAFLAWLSYGGLYLFVLGKERRRGLRERGDDFRVKRERKGVRFWRQVADETAQG